MSHINTQPEIPLMFQIDNTPKIEHAKVKKLKDYVEQHNFKSSNRSYNMKHNRTLRRNHYIRQPRLTNH